MKISTLLETYTTPTSDPVGNQSQQAPKFGRDPKVLETTTSGCVTTGTPDNLGVQRRGKGSIFQGVKTSKKFSNSKIKEQFGPAVTADLRRGSPAGASWTSYMDWKDKANQREYQANILRDKEAHELALKLGGRPPSPGVRGDGIFANMNPQQFEQWLKQHPQALQAFSAYSSPQQGVMEEISSDERQKTYNYVYQIMVKQAPEFMYRANNEDVNKAIIKAMGFGNQITPHDMASYAYGMLKSGDISEQGEVEGLNEMDKSQTPPGRDGDIDWTKKQIHLGPAHIIKAKDVAKHALKALDKTMKKSHADTPKKKGVAEGANADSQIKRIKDRILQLKDWNTAGTHDKKIKELQAKLKELQKQGVAEGNPIDTDWYRKQQERQTKAKQRKQGVAEGYEDDESYCEKAVRDNRLEEAEISEEMIAHELYKDLQIFKKSKDKTLGHKAKNKDLSTKPTDKEIISKVEKQVNESTQVDENLRKWFKEKWVRFGPDGKIRGACARGDDSEGKPKCLPQSKAHSLGKKGRKYAAAKKRREDPNPERRGPAKNVATKKKSNEGLAEAMPMSSLTSRYVDDPTNPAFTNKQKTIEKDPSDSLQGIITLRKTDPKRAFRALQDYGFRNPNDPLIVAASKIGSKVKQDLLQKKGITDPRPWDTTDEMSTLIQKSIFDYIEKNLGVAENYTDNKKHEISTTVELPKWQIGMPVYVKHLSQKGIIDTLGKDSAIVTVGMRQYRVQLSDLKRYSSKSLSEEQLDELKCWPGYTRVRGVPSGAPGSCKKKKTSESATEENCPHCGGPMFSEMIMNEKKDACYYKVKSRYKVWPSAYASGALVKCRNKGAKNWGNKS